jgi:hypothetical protein
LSQDAVKNAVPDDRGVGPEPRPDRGGCEYPQNG